MNKPDCLRFSILELNKLLMDEFWNDNVKPKYGKNAKFCYMHRTSFIVYVKTDDIYKGIAEDVETRSDTENFELDRPLRKGTNKKYLN